MIDFARDLNPAQYEAATHGDGPVLVVAGAGSGKTRTIVYRLAHLVSRGTPPQAILLLTFTRKAAQEMQQRAARLVGATGLAGLTGGTFHGFAYATLRRHPAALGLSQAPTILDQADAENALRDLRDELGLGKGDRSFPKKNTILGLISKARNKERELAEVMRDEAFHLLRYEDEIGQIARAYTGFKRKHGLVDYDDLLFHLETLLRDHEPAREAARRRFRHVMVDEYQDTNLVQARLVRLLAGEAGNVMAVGDDAQSIYAFRGADVRNILSFQQMFPGARLIRLERNYRSTQPILDLTNALLEQAEQGIRKRLYTEREDGPKPRLVRTLSDRSQAQAVVARIMELSGRHPLAEIAVLFRAGYHAFPVEVALNRLGIKYRKYGGIRFSEAAHIRDALAFLRLAQNPADLPAFKRVLERVRGVGPKSCAKLYDALLRGDAKAVAKACARNKELEETLHFLDGLRAAPGAPAALLARVLDFARPGMEKEYADDWPRRQAGLEQLGRIASGYADLDAFLADLCLESPDEGGDEDDGQALTLSTVHSAKGLEWSAVCIIDLVQDRFPSRHALTRAEDLEEERRLLYVACTRAREELALFVPATIYNQQSGSSEPALDSPFIAALPPGVTEAWRESYTGGLARTDGGDVAYLPAPPREPGPAGSAGASGTLPPEDGGDQRPASGPELRPPAPTGGPTLTPTRLGYCRHKIFGRGKVVAAVSEGKVRVNFPGFGLKVILSDFLEFE
ncbi:ATP-dependent helicase [Desulfocurvus sp.]|uniref:ATP-dependent helicase n=1 Tax=Desulfocurvus sp. TaxID=2871698 RepID=UPI0025C12D08|nr:ATP-dependent helicase [Desulfocurvus sp.]MCK9241505.1 ATP-dependent helicase [Desulfocurvus sp.]